MLINLFKKLMIVFLFLISFVPATINAQEVQVQLGANTTTAEQQERTNLGEEIRRRLIKQSFYDVFDWLEGELQPDGTLVLRGAVTRPTLKSGAERRVSDLAGVKRVVNEIEVLPVSPYDDRLRRRIYRAVYS